MLYFDYNATAPLSAVAREAWISAASKFIGNPSSPHRLGARADAALAGAREKVAVWLCCDPDEIVWTSGATESNNTVIAHLAAAGKGEAWVSAIEHPCVLAATRRYFEKRHRLIPVNCSGVVEMAWIERELKLARPAFVGVMAANNETGVLQPWPEIAARCRESGVPFMCDAAQWLGKMPAAGLGACDFVSGCAHKFGGPQGVGFLKCPTTTKPLLVGGAQEDGRRAGTENVAGVLAMVAALEAAETRMRGSNASEWRANLGVFENDLCRRLPGVEIVGAAANRLWNTVCAVMPEIDCRQRWVVKLDKLGFAVSTGSACASGKEKPSHVLAAMGISPAAAARALRLSGGWDTRAGDWSELLDGIERADRELNTRASEGDFSLVTPSPDSETPRA